MRHSFQFVFCFRWVKEMRKEKAVTTVKHYLLDVKKFLSFLREENCKQVRYYLSQGQSLSRTCVNNFECVFFFVRFVFHTPKCSPMRGPLRGKSLSWAKRLSPTVRNCILKRAVSTHFSIYFSIYFMFNLAIQW